MPSSSLDVPGPSVAAANPESELLLHCARVHVEADRQERIREVLAGDLNWERVLSRAATHGLTPLLHRHLSAVAPGAVPPEVLGTLAERFHSATRKALLLSGETARIAARAAEVGVRMLVLKGSGLALQAYGNVAFRPFGDMDLLISRSDFDAFAAVLAAQGYEPEPMHALKRRLHLLTEGQHAFWQFVQWAAQEGQLRGRKMAVEVHMSVMPMGYTYRGDVEELWERSVVFEVGGMRARTLSPEDHLLAACLHGFKDRWGRLKYLCDIAELIRRHPGLEWAAIMERARAGRCSRIFHLGVLLARDLLEAPFPADVAATAEQDHPARVLADEVIGHTLSEARFRVRAHGNRHRFILRAQDGLRGRAAYVSASALRHLTAPLYALGGRLPALPLKAGSQSRRTPPSP